MIREQCREVIVEQLFNTWFLGTSAGISEKPTLFIFVFGLYEAVLLNAMLCEDLYQLSMSL